MFAREANGGKLMIRSFCDLRRRKQGSSLPQSFSFRRKLTQSATILRMSSPTGKKQVIKVLLRFVFGSPCDCPAIRGRSRCRLHGGLSPGAPRGSRNGNFRDGYWTRDAIEERRWLRSLVKEFGQLRAKS